MATSVDYNAVLWNVRRKMVDAIELETPLFNMIKNRTSKDVVQGKNGVWYVQWPVNVRIPSVAKTISEGAALPTPSAAQAVLAQISLQTVATAISLTGETNEQGLIVGDLTIAENEVRNAVFDFSAYLEALLWGDGTGIRATVKSDAASDNVFIASSCRFLRVGMKVDIYNIDAGTKAEDSRTITAIDYQTKEVTLDGYAFQLTAGQGVVAEDMWNAESPGLMALLNDRSRVGPSNYANWYVTKGITTYAGLSRTTYSDWRTTILRNPSGSGTLRDLTASLLDLALAQAKANNKNTRGVSQIICDGGMAHTLAQVAPQSIVRSDNVKIIGTEGPIKYINYLDNTILQVNVMKSAPPHTIIFLCDDDLQVRWAGPPSWKRENGGSILVWQGNMPSGTNTYKGSYLCLLALIAKNPGRHIVLTDLNYHTNIASTYPL